MAFVLKCKPCEYTRISQPFKPGKHRGIDLVNKKLMTNTPIRAVADGTVVKAAKGALDWSYGNEVFIYHGNNYYTNYAHLSKICVKAGKKVKAGDIIGYMGHTGHCIPANYNGTHLHFEVWTKRSFSARVNPKPYLDAIGKNVDVANANYKVKTSGSNLIVRASASTKAKQLGKLANGSKIHSDKVEGNWLHITAPIAGYVYKNYTQKI